MCLGVNSGEVILNEDNSKWFNLSNNCIVNTYFETANYLLRNFNLWDPFRLHKIRILRKMAISRFVLSLNCGNAYNY